MQVTCLQVLCGHSILSILYSVFCQGNHIASQSVTTGMDQDIWLSSGQGQVYACTDPVGMHRPCLLHFDITNDNGNIYPKVNLKLGFNN